MASHGADLNKISEELNISRDRLVDFSSNVNPFGPSRKALKKLSENLDKAASYPDPAYEKLKTEIANYTDSNSGDILLGLGSTELIVKSIKEFKPKNALILNPSYSEYERELEKTECKIHYYEQKGDFKIDIKNLIREIELKKIDLFVFANPNNPTGTAIDPKDIEELLKLEINLIIDETYVEFAEKMSSSHLTKKYKNLIVIRSTSKFFACPGIRLGYAVTSNEGLKKSIRDTENLWEINIFADIMASEMFRDTEYQKKVREHNKKYRKIFKEKLKELKLKAVESSSNIILARLEEMSAKDLRDKLITEGLVIRDCSSFKGLDENYFRFCIMDEDSNERLIRALEKYIGKK